MFQKNSQITTGLLPEKMNKNCTVQAGKYSQLFSNFVTQGSRSKITAFLFLVIFLAGSGCEDSGFVGGDVEPGDDKVSTTEIELTDLTLLSEEGFSGRLASTGMGIVDDPAFGRVWSAALLKPSISQDNLDEFDEDSELKLRLVFNSLKYGDETSVSEYHIYEVDRRWRGNELTFNNPVSYDDSNLIGSFQVTDETSKDVELSEEWVDRYRQYFNSDAANRDSLYTFEFPGIAVVPADQNQRLDYLRHQPAESDTAGTEVTRFRIENEEDSLFVNMPLLDWGASMERDDDGIDEDDSFILHNTYEKILELDLDIDESQFVGQDIINAQLVFHVDQEPETTKPAGFARPNPALLRYHIFNADPLDLPAELFTTGATGSSTLNTDENFYQINITNYFLNDLYGSAEATPIYISLQTNNGLLYSSRFFNENGPAERTPKLIITTINSEN